LLISKIYDCCCYRVGHLLLKRAFLNKSGKKINCWEYMQCGREPGGHLAEALGGCPAAENRAFNGLNQGENAGRACWLVAGTFCDSKVQGSFARKKESCKNCGFYRKIHGEAGVTGLYLGTTRIAAHTYAGVVKAANEDRYLVKPLADGTILLALADGLGGDVSGDYAAEIACGTFAGIDCILAGREEAELKKLIRGVDLTVHDQTEKDPELTGMGSTLICVLIRENRVFWAHVGDSRLYFLTGGRLTRVTQDQMLSRFLVEEGEISAEQADSHYSRNVMDQYVGCGYVEPETGSLELLPDDILMLATDGLHRQISTHGLQALLNTSEPLEDKALTLIQAAVGAGGEDNITVVLATGSKIKSMGATDLEV
jgi:PPM family protein phosphatase